MHKLLLVHSDSKLRAIYGRKLSLHFSVDSAHSGLAAIRKIRLSPPQIILCQDELPYLSGFSVLKFIRKRPNLAAIPFIFISRSHPAPEALSLGGSEWINTSQVEIEHLVDRAMHHLASVYKLSGVNH